jgi:hypothetical protein
MAVRTKRAYGLAGRCDILAPLPFNGGYCDRISTVAKYLVLKELL